MKQEVMILYHSHPLAWMDVWRQKNLKKDVIENDDIGGKVL